MVVQLFVRNALDVDCSFLELSESSLNVKRWLGLGKHGGWLPEDVCLWCDMEGEGE